MDQQTDIWQQLSDDEMHFYSRQILLDGWDIDAIAPAPGNKLITQHAAKKDNQR